MADCAPWALCPRASASRAKASSWRRLSVWKNCHSSKLALSRRLKPDKKVSLVQLDGLGQGAQAVGADLGLGMPVPLAGLQQSADANYTDNRTNNQSNLFRDAFRDAFRDGLEIVTGYTELKLLPITQIVKELPKVRELD
jgi:hypothetical protein